MSEYYPYIIPGVIFLAVSYLIVNFIFDLLLRGFAPFFPSRPWVIDEILEELELPKEKNPTMIALSSGRSGFFYALEKKYRNSKVAFWGIEKNIFPFLVARVQTWLRRTRIKVKLQAIHRVNVQEANLIYSHLYPPDMADLGKKLKFECRAGTKIVSTGFNIPGLNAKKVINLPDRRGRFDFLSKNQNLLQRKSKKFKKEKKAFFYEI